MIPSYSSNRLDIGKFACSFFNISGNQSLLDVGCGHGIELELLQQKFPRKTKGVEPKDYFIECYHKQEKGELLFPC
jgi:trans-aconitate methyltransferase